MIMLSKHVSKHFKQGSPACSSRPGLCSSSIRTHYVQHHSVTLPVSMQQLPSSKASVIAPCANGVRARSRHGVHASNSAGLQAAEPGKIKLGFAGLGIMGTAMVTNLLKAGYEVHVWNRNASKCDPLVAAGAKAASSPAELAKAADYTFAMLSDPQAALEVVAGMPGAQSAGIVAGLGEGKGYIDVSTIDAATAQKIAGMVRGAGAAYLEAPVSGSKKPAEDGALIFLAAGDEELFKAVSGPLDVMGKAKFFLGEVGNGANMKLVVNMILGSIMSSFAEGLALAEKSGLKQQDLLEVLGLGATANPMFGLKGPSMTKRAYPTAFPLKHQQKDIRLALELGEEHKQSLPVASAANSLYLQAKEEGHGDQDFSAVLEAVMKAHK